MANAIEIRITNLPQIRSAFAKAPQLMTNELNTAIRKSIFLIHGKSMTNTPVLTGRLRASTATRFAQLKGEVGTHTNYDMYVHNGTRYMKARPYLLQAVESSNVQVNDFFTKAVDRVLNVVGRST